MYHATQAETSSTLYEGQLDKFVWHCFPFLYFIVGVHSRELSRYCIERVLANTIEEFKFAESVQSASRPRTPSLSLARQSSSALIAEAILLVHLTAQSFSKDVVKQQPAALPKVLSIKIRKASSTVLSKRFHALPLLS